MNLDHPENKNELKIEICRYAKCWTWDKGKITWAHMAMASCQRDCCSIATLNYGLYDFQRLPYEDTTTQGSYLFRNTSPICLLTTALKSLDIKTHRPPSENWVLLTLLTQNDSQRWLGEKVVVEKEKAHGEPRILKNHRTAEIGEIFTVGPWNEWYVGLWFRRELKKVKGI